MLYINIAKNICIYKKIYTCVYKCIHIFIYINAYIYNIIYIYIYISYPYIHPRHLCLAAAKIVIPSVGNLRPVKAKRSFFFSSSKMCVLTCGHQWIWARPFCVANAVFYDIAKPCVFAGRRALFCFFWTSWIFGCCFSILFAGCCACFFRWGSGRGVRVLVHLNFSIAFWLGSFWFTWKDLIGWW